MLSVKCYTLHSHNHFSETKAFWLIGLFTITFDKDCEDEVVTEQLTAVVDVTFMPHDIPVIFWMATRSINQRHHDRVMYQVMVSMWVSQTLARPIL